MIDAIRVNSLRTNGNSKGLKHYDDISDTEESNIMDTSATSSSKRKKSQIKA